MKFPPTLSGLLETFWKSAYKLYYQTFKIRKFFKKPYWILIWISSLFSDLFPIFFLTAGLTTLLINGVETALNTSFDIISIDDNTDVAHNVSKGEIAFSLGSGSGLVIGYSDMLLQATLSYESDDVER